MSEPSNTIIAVLDDLFFTVKIADAAKRAGLQVKFVKTPEAAKERLQEKPVAIIIDLNYSSIDPVPLVSQMKQSEFREIPIIGYVSHVQIELKQRAQEAGCDTVLARSALASSLPQLLRKHAGFTD